LKFDVDKDAVIGYTVMSYLKVYKAAEGDDDQTPKKLQPVAGRRKYAAGKIRTRVFTRQQQKNYLRVAAKARVYNVSKMKDHVRALREERKLRKNKDSRAYAAALRRRNKVLGNIQKVGYKYVSVLRPQLGAQFNNGKRKLTGTRLFTIRPGRAAEDAGLHEEDYVLAVNGRETPDRVVFKDIVVGHCPIGRVSEFTYRRGQQVDVAQVTMGARGVGMTTLRMIMRFVDGKTTERDCINERVLLKCGYLQKVVAEE
jgi:hypothetical protein